MITSILSTLEVTAHILLYFNISIIMKDNMSLDEWSQLTGNPKYTIDTTLYSGSIPSLVWLHLVGIELVWLGSLLPLS